MQKFGDGRDWFFEKRFGLFVHWGLYAIPGWHEQFQWRRGVPRREYERLSRRFNPTRFEPDAWLDLAAAAGMSYLCFTTKHHDGFCLWNTAQTDFNVMHTPYGRDVLGMLADACHRRGFPLCLYYSVVDWHHPNYPNQNRSHELPGPQEDDDPHLGRYLRFLQAQVRELCTQYGELHGFWWDMNVTGHRDPAINGLIRKLQPKAVINNRGFDDGDFGTPERDWDKDLNEALSFERPTEACQSVGTESWGYRKHEDYYTEAHLVHSIDQALAKGANYLLNVGPKADGTIPARAAGILRAIGRWYHAVKESFEGAEPVSPITDNRSVLLTLRGNALYVHLHKPAVSRHVLLNPIAVLPRRATVLNTGAAAEVRLDVVPSLWASRKAWLRIRQLPAKLLNETAVVVKLEFDDRAEAAEPYRPVRPDTPEIPHSWSRALRTLLEERLGHRLADDEPPDVTF